MTNLLEKSSTIYAPQLKFSISNESASSNLEILKKNHWDLDKVLTSSTRSITNYGSEFKSVVDLEKLLSNHPRWKVLKEKLLHGCSYPIEKLDEKERLMDLSAAIKFGNHKSAYKNEEVLSKAMEKEVQKGWAILLPDKNIEDIPDLVISPLGVAEHLGISSDGTYIPKKRITHDLSWPGKLSKQSINSRMDQDLLEPVMIGHCLLRIIHYIVNLRKHFPNSIIWIRKRI